MIPSGLRPTTPEQRKKKYALTELFPGCWVMKDAYIGEYVFGAKILDFTKRKDLGRHPRAIESHPDQ